MTDPGTTTSHGKATVPSPLAPNTAPSPGTVLLWFERDSARMADKPIVAPAAMRVPRGMDCSHAGAVTELIVRGLLLGMMLCSASKLLRAS